MPASATRKKLWWGDVVLTLGVLALLVFPVASRLAADAEPIAPPAGVRLPALHAGASAGQIRGLPVFVSTTTAGVASQFAGGGPAASRAIDGRLRDLFGARRARAIVRGVSLIPPGGTRLPPLAPASPAQENDLAALLMIDGAMSTTGLAPNKHGFPAAGALALDLLEHAIAGGGGCASELNLAFLWASDAVSVPDNPAVRDYEKAITACPGDPTPLWALGQYQLQTDRAAGNAASDGALFATFKRLERSFPGVAASWAGEGDADMLAGYQLEDSQPFVARERFNRARALYERAVRLQPNFQNRAGLARALAALGDLHAAIATQRRALAPYPASAELQARLLDYLQRAHRFAQAAAVAAGLSSVHSFPSGVELYAAPFTEPPSSPATAATKDASGDEDVADPLSTGAGVMEPADIVVLPQNAVGATGITENLSYLPVYRPMSGIGGSARWCPGWSRLVDLFLTGKHAAAVVREFSPQLVDLRPVEGDCDAVLNNGPADLAGVAELELGNVGAAARMDAPATISQLEDLRQNLWRYAGDLPGAAEAAREWAVLQPDNAVAIERQGEIAFLRGLYNQAADDFAVVVNRARLQHGGPSEEEASALLDQGTALAYAKRRTEALATLAAASETAARWGGASSQANGSDPLPAEVTAFASEQAGDTLLESGHPLQAREDYAVALDAESTISTAELPPQAVPLVPDALDNNAAVAAIATHEAAKGAALAASAIKIDPGDPIFWWTAGEAQQQLGHREQAISDYRTSLALDPSEFPVANDLGVLLMRAGDPGAAVAALRRSVGANRGYATGWFNLGVALQRLGPLHIAAAEGSLARARKLDSKLASRGPVPLLDNVTYQTHLDLSKPLPANWTFVSSQNHSSVVAASLSAILVIALTLARSLSARAAPGGAEKWFDMIDAVDRKVPSMPRLHAPAVGIVATAAFLLWPLHSGPTDGWAATATFALGVLILIAVMIRVRQLAARHLHISVRQETWPPALAFGLVLTLAGAGWSPLPVARARDEAKAMDVHWAGPIALAGLAIVLLVLATWLNVPLTRSLGAAGLVMAASLLTPVKPLDGATVSTTAVGALPSLVLLGAAVLMLLGLL